MLVEGFEVDDHCAAANVVVANQFSVIGKQDRKTANFSIPSRAVRNHAQAGAACVLLLGRFAVPSVRARRSRLSCATRNQEKELSMNEMKDGILHSEMNCPLCIGKFWFPTSGHGTLAPCPHCQKQIRLAEWTPTAPTRLPLEKLRSNTQYGGFRSLGAFAGCTVALSGVVTAITALQRWNPDGNWHGAHEGEGTACLVLGIAGVLICVTGLLIWQATHLAADIADAHLIAKKDKP
jgi:hypothetical protein